MGQQDVGDPGFGKVLLGGLLSLAGFYVLLFEVLPGWYGLAVWLGAWVPGVALFVVGCSEVLASRPDPLAALRMEVAELRARLDKVEGGLEA